MNPVPRGLAVVTGAWLGLWQVSIGHSLLLAGGGFRTLFVLTLAWLLSGAAMALLLARREHRATLERRLLFAALASGLGAQLAAAAAPTARVSLFLLIAAAAIGGAYATAFLVERGRDLPRPQLGQLLLFENNGFLVGYAGATGLIFWRGGLLLPAALTLGLVAAGAATPPRPLDTQRQRRTALLALLLATGTTLGYALFPLIGDSGWDGLMTASVLARIRPTGLREWLFFAHPLTIPLTWPFSLFVDDPLSAVRLREATCAGAVTALAYLGGRALSGPRAGLFAAAVLCTATGRWALATTGEEKELATLFGGSFLWLYLDHRGAWDLRLPSWRRLSVRQRQLFLGALLAVAAEVHVMNGVLALVVLGDAILSWRTEGRRSLIDALAVLVAAAVLAGPFFLWLAIGPGGARSASAIVRIFLEYHLSGEFLSVPDSWVGRFVAAGTGAHRYALGPLPLPWPRLELIAASLAAGLLLVRALRTSPAASRLSLWIGVLSAHFFFFQPWDEEAWAGAALPLVVVLGSGLLRDGAWQKLRQAAAVLVVLALVVVRVEAQRDRQRSAQRVSTLLELPVLSFSPSATLAKYVDARLPEEALLLVDDRLQASYFQLYTRRRPLVRPYLDLDDVELGRRFLLTNLSKHFYKPTLSSTEISASAQGGRPVYLLTRDPLPGAVELGFDELRLGKVELRRAD